MNRPKLRQDRHSFIYDFVLCFSRLSPQSCFSARPLISPWSATLQQKAPQQRPQVQPPCLETGGLRARPWSPWGGCSILGRREDLINQRGRKAGRLPLLRAHSCQSEPSWKVCLILGWHSYLKAKLILDSASSGSLFRP